MYTSIFFKLPDHFPKWLCHFTTLHCIPKAWKTLAPLISVFIPLRALVRTIFEDILCCPRAIKTQRKGKETNAFHKINVHVQSTFMYIISFNPRTNAWWLFLLSPACKWGTGSERPGVVPLGLYHSKSLSSLLFLLGLGHTPSLKMTSF